MPNGNDISILYNTSNALTIKQGLSVLYNNVNTLSGNGGVSVLSAALVLDQLSVSPAAAYSLRLTRSAYTGPAIRVRRSSDNAEQDIGFTALGNLDTVSLLAFVGSNSGYISKWYDQSGNGYDATQTTAANQPRVVNAGVVETSSGRPAIFTTTGLSISNAGTWLITGNADRALNAVLNRQSGNNMSAWSGVHAANQAWGVDGNAAPVFAPYTYGTGDLASGTLAANTPTILTASRASGTSFGFRSGTSLGTNATAISTAVGIGIGIGVRPDGASSIGWYSEMTYFSAALSTIDRQALERNQGAYYGISVA